jgi:DNA repair exonuclease SbcCD ATPase subunit
VAHALEDGGGRELAYVKLSRARERSTVYVVADDLEQAVEDLARGWSVSRRLRWAIDTGVPSRGPERPQPTRHVDPHVRAALRHGRLVAERDALVAAVPADWRDQVCRNVDALVTLGHQRRALAVGGGRYADTAVGAAARELAEARRQREWTEALAVSRSEPRRRRRSFAKEAELWGQREAEIQQRWQRLARPELARLDREENSVRRADETLCERVRNRSEWLERHPEAASRIARLEREIETLEYVMDPEHAVFEPSVARQPRVGTVERGREIEPPSIELGF